MDRRIIYDEALVVPEDAFDELCLFAAPGVESESFACPLEILASKGLKHSAKVERSLSDDGVDVRVSGTPVVHLQLEPGCQLGQPFAGELPED